LSALVFVIHAIVAAPAPPAPATSPGGPVGAPGVFGSVADFGKALFTVHILPFEVTALILMVAVIGVITLTSEHIPSAVSRKSEAQVDREMREAILRGGER
jgi:NADH:ubiquinone oxidoreductase subunit 6 (subunit J)